MKFKQSDITKRVMLIIRTMIKAHSDRFLSRINVSTFFLSSSLGNDDVTVGKFYATFLIQEWFRRWKLKKAEEHKHLPYGQHKRHSIMPFRSFCLSVMRISPGFN
ncbi:hypothetical protein ACTXT7_016651 [Hymenolepis weldensis]